MAEDNPMSWLDQPQREGWGEVNRTGLTPEEAAEQQRALLEQFETAKLFAEVLTTGRGPALMEHLAVVLFETPIYKVHGAMAFEALEIQLTPSEWAMIRTGQNSVLHHFRAMIDRARMGPPTVEATERTENDG